MWSASLLVAFEGRFVPENDVRTNEVSNDLNSLLTEIAAGNRESFARFYDLTCDRVFGMALKVLRDRGFAQDTTQEVFLQVWQDARRFDAARGSAVTWVIMLAHRRAVDRVRTENACIHRESTHAARHQIGPVDYVSDEVIDRMDRAAVHDRMTQLTAAQREAIELAFFNGCTYQEVANVLGVALPTIKSRIRDGLIRMRVLQM